ncbi:MAG: hypothetical protein WD029_08375 [Microthrixaceae bacterium]
MTALLPDGSYDAFVIDLTEELDRDGLVQTFVELTIVAGEHKGLVLQIASDSSLGPFEDILGMPATLTVLAGTPSIRIDE